MPRSSTLLATLLIALSAVSVVTAAPGHGNARGHRSKQSYTDPLLVLARDVAEVASSLHRIAERTAHHRNHRADQALGQFHELDARARDFRNDLQRFGPYDRRVRFELFELQRSVDRARYAAGRMHASRPVARQLARLGGLVRDLDRAYDTRLATLRHDGHRGDARYRCQAGHGDHHDDRHSGGYVRIGTRWGDGATSIGFRWGD